MPTWSQLEANIYAKIIEKPLFFLGFFDILRKSLEAFGTPWGAFWECLGEALGTPGRALGTRWGALGGPWETLGTPWEALGAPWEAFGTPWETLRGEPWKNLGRTSLMELQEAACAARALNLIFF